jgi:hypothetical protein
MHRRLGFALALLLPLLAAAAAPPAACDLEHPDGKAGCSRAVVDRLHLNDLQAVGTHNSYKQALPPAEMALLAGGAPAVARTLDYSHPPLTDQLDAGARQLELDIVYDPGPGGRYADPLFRKLAGAKAGPYDPTPMRGPGLKVLHVQDVDFRSSCALFTDCLKSIAAWSRAHPDHLPLLILLNLKEDDVPIPGSVKALKFDPAGMDSIDAEIRSVFSPRELIVPDQVQGRHNSLREGALAGGWPTLKASRGKVFFALDAEPDQVARYREGRRSLEGRVMFVNIDEASPAAAYITLNEPITDCERIRRDVAMGLVVRTRADADTVEARSGDTARREAAFACGAQYVSTDYMRPDARFGAYRVGLPGGGVGRPDPVRK